MGFTFSLKRPETEMLGVFSTNYKILPTKRLSFGVVVMMLVPVLEFPVGMHSKKPKSMNSMEISHWMLSGRFVQL